MENRQRSIRKLLWRITAVLAILAVVSICFVSGTFARYVSNRSGSTVTEVAKWDIEFKNGTGADENNFTVTVGKLSPDKDEYGKYDDDDNKKSADATYDQRVKTTDAVLALQITNSGDVDAYLTITAIDTTEYGTKLIYYGTYSETAGGSNPYKNPEGAEDEELVWGTTGFADNGTPSAAQAEAVITMQFALVPQNTNVADITWYSLGQEGSNLGTSLTLKALPAEGGLGDGETNVYCFYARAVWTSQDQEGKDYADALDTWFGEHIAAVGAAFTFSVVQASELPGTNP